MLKFNSYRARRYLRSKFIEGKYLLASEATDLELELLDVLRKSVQNTIGDNVAFEDAWKVEYLTQTQVLVRPGEAFFKGLPFLFRSGQDQLVSGAILTLGIVPVGVTITDDSTGLGKVITFNDGSTTPSNTYKVLITAKEELITETTDLFLQNANLTESTAQKIRLVFQLNIVPDSLQTESPVPYTDESSASLSVTNFPNTGGFSSPNLVNQINVTPTASGNGELINTTLITGSEKIDGRDVELTLTNNSSLGGGHPIPKSPTEQQAFSNGTLIDSVGSIYHINAIFNDVVSTQVILRVDKEPNQPNPQIINTKPFTLVKREVFVTDDTNGIPQGKLYWPVAKISWNQTSGLEHASKVTDLRNVSKTLQEFEEHSNQKSDLVLTGGGNVNFSSDVLTWDDNFIVINPYGQNQTVFADSAGLVDGSSVVYKLDLNNNAIISIGTTLITIGSTGTTVNTDPGDDLSYFQIGNTLKLGSQVVEITAIDDINKQLQVTPALTTTGTATVYLDVFGPTTAPYGFNSYVLATRKNNKVYLDKGSLELEVGETDQLGDGITAAMLTLLGATDENDDAPDYTTNHYVTDGNSLVTAISSLDAALFTLSGTVAAINWKAPVANYAALPASGNTDGDVRLVLDTRVIYTWDNTNTVWVEDGYWKGPAANFAALPATHNKNGDVRVVLDTHIAYYWDSTASAWKPLTGASGMKLIGGGTLTNTATPGSPSSLIATGAISGNSFTIAQPNFSVAQTFTLTQNTFLSSIDVYIEELGGAPSATLSMEIYSTSAGLPNSSLYVSTTTHNAASVPGSGGIVNFDMNNLSLAAGQYAFVVKSTGAPATPLFTLRAGSGSVYAGGDCYRQTGSPTWNPTLVDAQFTIYGSLATIGFTFTANMYLERAGLAYTDNTISTSQSPVSLSNDYDVAYVIPNLSTGGPSLTVSTGALSTVPINAIILARREGTDIIIGSSSTRLLGGQSSKLYAQSSDQTLSYMGSTDTSTSAPSYSSDIRGIAGQNLTARAGALTDVLGDQQEDRSAYLRSDNTITWTGTQLQFTSDIVLEIVNTKSGTSKTATILASNSPISLANGESAWISISRTTATENVTVNLSGTLAIPAQSQTNKDVFVIARRQDAGGIGYLHLPLHKQVLDSGQTVRLGASGSGSLTIRVTAGENLTANDAVYISKGNANGDTGRTLGQAYKLDRSNDNRMEFIGFVTKTVSSGSSATIQIAGELSGFSGLTQGLPLFADSGLGAYTQTAPSTTGFWLIPLGSASSASTVVINAAGAATAIYLVNSNDSFSVANNVTSQDVTGLFLTGASYRSMRVTYSLRRKTDTALSEVVQVGELRAWYNTQANTYDVAWEYSGDNVGVTFSITAAGQIQYTSTNITGTNYVGEMRYIATKFDLGV